MRPTGGRSEDRSLHTHHMLSNLLASLASFHTRSPRCSLALRSARLACSARFACAALLASADLRSRFARACRLACFCFARLAGCSVRSTRLSRCSLRSSSLLLPSLASLGPLLLCARCLACCALASLVSSPAARSARCLDCGSLRSPQAAPPAARFARRLPARSARLSHSPCPPRCSSIFCAGELKSPLSLPWRVIAHLVGTAKLTSLCPGPGG